MRFRKQGGQSLLEYCILLMIIIAAFLSMQTYIKRGFMGRWKASVDDIGDQYDPRLTSGVINYTTTGTSSTTMQASYQTLNGVNGYYTLRTDVSQTVDMKNGYLATGL